VTGVVLAAVWGLGAIAMFRPVFRGLVNERFGLAASKLSKRWITPDWTEVVVSLCLAFTICAVFWPAAAAFFLLRPVCARHDPSLFARRLAGETAEQKLERMERERERREEHIGRLERELGIGQ
jgi:hypothetical protein